MFKFEQKRLCHAVSLGPLRPCRAECEQAGQQVMRRVRAHSVAALCSPTLHWVECFGASHNCKPHPPEMHRQQARTAHLEALAVVAHVDVGQGVDEAHQVRHHSVQTAG